MLVKGGPGVPANAPGLPLHGCFHWDSRQNSWWVAILEKNRHNIFWAECPKCSCCKVVDACVHHWGMSPWWLMLGLQTGCPVFDSINCSLLEVWVTVTNSARWRFLKWNVSYTNCHAHWLNMANEAVGHGKQIIISPSSQKMPSISLACNALRTR